MKKSVFLMSLMMVSSTVFGMFGNGSSSEQQSNDPGFTFSFPINQEENQVKITCIEEKSTQTKIASLEEGSTQTEEVENLNNSLHSAFLSYIKSKNLTTDLMLFATKSNHLDVIDCLIENNTDINATINGQSSLYHAIYNKNLQLADHLILNGAIFRTNEKESLLFFAIESNHFETVKYLIDKGLNIKYTTNYRGYSSCRSFLDIAVLKKNFDIAKYLIEHGAELNSVSRYVLMSFVIENDSLELVKHLVSKGTDINLIDNNKQTLLHNAVILDKFDIVEYLVNDEATNINAQDSFNYTPLLYAIEKKYTEIAELLIKKLAEKDDINKSLNLMGKSKDQNIDKTPLYEACLNGNFDIVKLLVENGADINRKASNGICPIDIALQNDHIDIAKFLIDKGADVNAKDNDGRSIINKAVEKELVSFVKYLIEKGAKINRQSNDGWTLLHEVAQSGNKEIAKILIDNDAFVNARDNRNWTPLHEACLSKNFDIVKLLIENGADINIADSNGITSQYISQYIEKYQGNSNIYQYISRRTFLNNSVRLTCHNKTEQQRNNLIVQRNNSIAQNARRI